MGKTDVSTLATSLGTSQRALFREITFKTCPDGTPYTLLKHPEKAFQIFGSDWDANIGVAVDKLQGFAAKVGIDLKKRVKALYEGLDAINAAFAQSYNASYLTYSTRPCDKDSVADLRKSNERLQKSTMVLLAIKIESSRSSPDVKLLEGLQANLEKIVES